MKLVLATMLMLSVNQALAMSVDWSGGYRAEWVEVDRPSLSTPKNRKSYILNELYLSPKIIAADGVNITSRFDVLPNQDSRYQNSQLGQFWGPGVRKTTTATDATNSNTLSQNQPSTNLTVSQLYLTVNQEFGQLVVGRTPLQFGLGIRHNAGNGMFDHWYDTRDIAGYKVVTGNLFLMPMLGRAYSGSIGQGNQINDQMFHLQYDNQETGSMLGIFYEARRGAQVANDTPAMPEQSPVTVTGEFFQQNVNVFLGREWDSFNFKIEAGFTSGNSGVSTPAGEEIKFNGYGIATDMNFINKESKWAWNLKMGIASGDNPETKDYEGYVFDRNYDVAMLMFNHPMGKADFLRTGLTRNASYSTQQVVDEEAISNASYFSPNVTYKWSDKFDLKNSLTYAMLNAQPIAGQNIDKSLGFEWDVDLIYKPYEKITWVNSLGVFTPGAAFKGGTNAFDTNMNYGFTSKAAISF